MISASRNKESNMEFLTMQTISMAARNVANTETR